MNRGEAKQICRRKTPNMDRQLKTIQEKYDRNESKNFYRKLKTMDGNNQHKKTMFED